MWGCAFMAEYRMVTFVVIQVIEKFGFSAAKIAADQPMQFS
jgi:hypothetical protein